MYNSMAQFQQTARCTQGAAAVAHSQGAWEPYRTDATVLPAHTCQVTLAEGGPLAHNHLLIGTQYFTQ